MPRGQPDCPASFRVLHGRSRSREAQTQVRIAHLRAPLWRNDTQITGLISRWCD